MFQESFYKVFDRSKISDPKVICKQKNPNNLIFYSILKMAKNDFPLRYGFIK